MELTRGLAVISWLKINDIATADLTPEEKTCLNNALANTNIGLSDDFRHHWGAAFAQAHWPRQSLLLADSNTWAALGENIKNELEAAGYYLDILVLDTPAHADIATLNAISNHARATHAKAIIAVGSGTLNDLAKSSSHALGVPYAICGTAPSMNGYLSANAAIMEHGHKRSIAAHLPRLALFDIATLNAAPTRMKAAGLGDAICRSTAQVDWLLSYHLLQTPYLSLPFKLLAPYENKMLEGDMQALISSLLISGLGMTLAGGSYPASQGEHLLAHYIEMQYPAISHQHLHGEHIAVTTILIANHQQKLLNGHSAPALRTAPSESQCKAHFGEDLGRTVWHEWQQKEAAIKKLTLDNALWQEVRKRLLPYHISAPTLLTALKKASAPTTPQAIGWSAQMLEEAWQYAPLIRNRFTCLDLFS